MTEQERLIARLSNPKAHAGLLVKHGTRLNDMLTAYRETLSDAHRRLTSGHPDHQRARVLLQERMDALIANPALPCWAWCLFLPSAPRAGMQNPSLPMWRVFEPETIMRYFRPRNTREQARRTTGADAAVEFAQEIMCPHYGSVGSCSCHWNLRYY